MGRNVSKRDQVWVGGLGEKNGIGEALGRAMEKPSAVGTPWNLLGRPKQSNRGFGARTDHLLQSGKDPSSGTGTSNQKHALCPTI